MLGLFLHVLCRCDMPFLEKLADIAVSRRHVVDMLATFPAKKVTTKFHHVGTTVLFIIADNTYAKD
jgi:hypothetical protein